MPASFRNDNAVFPWIIIGFFLCGCLLMTYLLIRDGAFPGTSQQASIGIASLFWLGGLGAGAWAFGKHRLRVEVWPDHTIWIARSWPLRNRTEQRSPSTVLRVLVVEDKDSDGDPYYSCRVLFKDGLELDIQEGHTPEESEEARDRFLNAIGRDSARLLYGRD